MCKKWYQLITCTEPVGALNRRSFFMLKSPVSNSWMRGFLSLLMVLVILQVFCRCFFLPHQLLNSSC